MDTPRAPMFATGLAVGLAVLASLLPVAASFSISYEHLRDLAVAAGFSDTSAHLLPLGIDGALAAATISLIVNGLTGRKLPATAWALGGVGIASSVAGNIVAAQPKLPAPEFTSAAVAALPPIVLALSIEVVLRLVWTVVTGGFRTQSTPAPLSGPEVEPERDSDRTPDASPLGLDEVNAARDLTGHAQAVVEPAGQADNQTPDAAGQPDGEAATGQDTGQADTDGTPTGEPDREAEAPANVRSITRAPVRPVRPARPAKAQTSDTAAEIARLMKRHPELTQKQIAEEIGVDVRTVRRHQAAMSSEGRAS